MTFKRFLRANPYLFALLLLVILVMVSAFLQKNFFKLGVINGNLRVFLPLMILAVGQTTVIIGGGIDLSVGMIVSLVNAVLVTLITIDSSPGSITLAILAGCGTGMLAGALNGICVAWLRLQPVVTTYATSFVFAGLALLILPRPGGELPRALTSLYRSTPFSIPFPVYVIIALLLLWWLIRGSRFGQYIYAMGGNPEAAYTTGLAVTRLRFSIYVVSGLFAALASAALTLSIGSGNPRIGEAMTLESVVATVLGGTRLSGGQGGIVGTIIGVAILGLIRNIISFANVPTWYQTLVNAIIIVLALAGPGVVNLFLRRQRV
jgi:ribose transport system permease protein